MRRQPCALHGSQRDTAGASPTDPRTRARDRNGERSRGAETRNGEGGGRGGGPHQPRKRRWGKSRRERGREGGRQESPTTLGILPPFPPSLPCSIPSTFLLLVLLLHTKEGEASVSFLFPDSRNCVTRMGVVEQGGGGQTDQGIG